jgi:hypothetical protein
MKHQAIMATLGKSVLLEYLRASQKRLLIHLSPRPVSCAFGPLPCQMFGDLGTPLANVNINSVAETTGKNHEEHYKPDIQCQAVVHHTRNTAPNKCDERN